jgi:hypothetical protein
MKRSSHINMTGIMTLILAAFAAPQCVCAEQIKAVMTKVTALGSGANNTSAMAVKTPGVGLIVMGKGTHLDTSGGQFRHAGSVSQIAIVLPSKNSDLSFLQALCVDRFDALQSGRTKRPLEVTFEGSASANGSYVATKLLGCADVTSLPSTSQVRPAATPTPTPKPKA